MLSNKRLFLLDIDGTICIGKALIPGAKQLLTTIQEQGNHYVFITNNATKGVDEYMTWFHSLGIEVEAHNFMTASMVTAMYMKKHMANDVTYVLGTEGLVRELMSAGLTVTTDITNKDVTAVCVSYDNTLTYEKVSHACELLTNPNVKYIATNPDLTCPIEFGYVPDCGAICEMITHAVKRKPIYMGKPNTRMVDYARKLHSATREETVIIGDRLYTDIYCGNKAKVDTVLVLSGETKEVTERTFTFEEYVPTHIMGDVGMVEKELKRVCKKKEAIALNT